MSRQFIIPTRDLDAIHKAYYEPSLADRLAESPLLKRLGIASTYSNLTIYDLQSQKYTKQIDRMKYLIATGYAYDAEQIAKQLATLIYNDELGRRVCEYTGQTYFDKDYN